MHIPHIIVYALLEIMNHRHTKGKTKTPESMQLQATQEIEYRPEQIAKSAHVIYVGV